MTVSTPINPFVFSLTGHVPALKNNREPVYGQDQNFFVANAAVERFYRQNESILIAQRDRQKDLEFIPMPRAAVLVVQLFYIAVTVPLPKADGDNGYTTIQELLQVPEMPHGILGIVEDDRQVQRGIFEVKVVKSRPAEGCRFYVWQDNGDPLAIQLFDWHVATGQRSAPGETPPDTGSVDELEISE